jgi:hypothetical protein
VFDQETGGELQPVHTPRREVGATGGVVATPRAAPERSRLGRLPHLQFHPGASPRSFRSSSSVIA